MTIDSEELVKRMKAFGLKGVRDGSVHFFIKPELLAEFLEAEIRAEREACAKIARQYEPDERLECINYASDLIMARSTTDTRGEVK